MKFYGKPADERGGTGPARVQFHNGVRAWTRESVLSSVRHVGLLRRPHRLRQAPEVPERQRLEPRRSARTTGRSRCTRPPTPPAQIARVVCEQNVDVVTRKFNDDGVLTEKRHIEGQRLIYERNNNRFSNTSLSQNHVREH